jgi:RNA polymerase sigma-70 factor (ECF subfamily)
MIYCVVPRDLAPKLHDSLRRFYRDDAGIEVIVEQRSRDRRRREDRRAAGAAPAPKAERRRVQNPDGRRVTERRGALVVVDAPPMPRKARPHADRLVFIELPGETTQQAEDAAADRLVARFQSGDREAFTELYMHYFDRVYDYLGVVLRNSTEAEDAAQHVFLATFEALPRYEFRGRPFRAWLFVIVRNHALRLLTERGRVQPVAPTDDLWTERASTPDEHDLGALEWLSDRELVMFIERLPLAQRQVLLLRFMLDLSAGETAAVIGSTPQAVRQLQARALRYLRTRFAGLGRTVPNTGRVRSQSRIRPVVVTRARRFALQRW